MNISINKSKFLLIIMALVMSFAVTASVETDVVNAIKANPKNAAALIQAAAKANPGLAASIALAVVKAQIPELLPSVIASAAAKGAPLQAAAIVKAVVKAQPSSAAAIASAVVKAVPSKAGAITQAAVEADPDSAMAITEAIITSVLSSPSVVQTPDSKSESTTSNITLTDNVIVTDFEKKFDICASDATCINNAAIAAMKLAGSTNPAILSLLAGAIVTKVETLTTDTGIITGVTNATKDCVAASCS